MFGKSYIDEYELFKDKCYFADMQKSPVKLSDYKKNHKMRVINGNPFRKLNFFGFDKCYLSKFNYLEKPKLQVNLLSNKRDNLKILLKIKAKS